jgi:hypothetical protein
MVGLERRETLFGTGVVFQIVEIDAGMDQLGSKEEGEVHYIPYLRVKVEPEEQQATSIREIHVYQLDLEVFRRNYPGDFNVEFNPNDLDDYLKKSPLHAAAPGSKILVKAPLFKGISLDDQTLGDHKYTDGQLFTIYTIIGHIEFTPEDYITEEHAIAGFAGVTLVEAAHPTLE